MPEEAMTSFTVSVAHR